MKPAAFYVLPTILLMALIACSNPEGPVIDEELQDLVWKVDTLRTPEELIVPGDTLMTVVFSSTTNMVGHNFHGRGACHQFEGTYEINRGGTIHIDITHVTSEGCQGRTSYIDFFFTRALEGVDQYAILAETLRLNDSNWDYLLTLSVHQLSM